MQGESLILRDLREYYDKNKILSTNFDCKHLAKCQSCLPPTPVDATIPTDAEDTFTQAKAAFVGDRYCEHVPRLLFVSLDPGRVLTDKDSEYTYVLDENRSPDGVQKGEINRAQRIHNKQATPSTRLCWTNKMAERVLEKSIGSNIMRFYAHINAVKCTMNKKGSKQADDRLFEHCREYLLEEIDILSPDVIVTLGKQAKNGVASAFSIASKPAWGRDKAVSLPNGRTSLWLPIYHTSYFGGFHRQRNKEWGPDWEQFIKRVREFMSSRV